MDVLFCLKEPAKYFFFATDVPSLLYYSHIPTVLISLLLGFYVFFKNRDSLASKALLFVSLVFGLWSAIDLILWAQNDSRIIMFFWSLIVLIEPMIFAGSLYMTEVFITKKDISFSKKIFLAILLLPIMILLPTNYNLTGFNVAQCVSSEGFIAIKYVYSLELFLILWIVFSSIRKSMKVDSLLRKQIILLSSGVVLFLLSFSGANFVSSITGTDVGFQTSQYGLFGMPVFIGFLAYIIVKFNAFNIKLIGAQVLIVGQFILIASMFAFIQTATNVILTAITLVLTVIMGWNLIRSVKKEIEQKEQLEIANSELSQRKNELQYISDKLAESNDKLRTLDNAKTEFISIASHQLRTPPTAIKGYASLLEEGTFGEMNEKQKEALKKITQANDQQIHFVEDLLNVSRIESGRMEYTFAEYNAESLCQNAVDNLFFKAKDNDLYLDFKKSGVSLPHVTVDGPKVLEVISNMIDNALKYTPKGGVTVRVAVCEKNAETCVSSEHVRITISDTGIGIPETELPYLFAKFSRGKDISRLNTGGIGLGLYVGKIMIEANGGRIWAESEGKDRGSHFIIELPVKQAESESHNTA